MNTPFDAQTTLQAFVYAVLSANSAVTTALGGAGRIYPDVAPASLTTQHLVHEDYGGVAVDEPMGPVGMVTMRWAITGWDPSRSRQAIRPAMKAAMAVLIGADTRGKTHRFVDAESTTWAIYCRYFGPDKVPLDVGPADWAPVRVVYSLSLQQVA